VPRFLLGPRSQFSGHGPWRVRRAGRPFEIRRVGEESFVAIELACRHQNTDLSGCPERDGLLVCPRHGWRYRAETGECLDDPGRPLRVFSVIAEGERLWIKGQDIN